MVKREPKSLKDKNSIIFKSIILYHKIPDILRTYNTKKIKKHIKDFIFQNFANNSIPKYDND